MYILQDFFDDGSSPPSVLENLALLECMGIRQGLAPAEPSLTGSVVSGADREVNGVETEGVKDKRFTKQVPRRCFVFFPIRQNPKRGCQPRGGQESERDTPDTTKDQRLRLKRV